MSNPIEKFAGELAAQPQTESSAPQTSETTNPLAAAVDAVQRKRGRPRTTVQPTLVETPKSVAPPIRIYTEQEKRLAGATVQALTHSMDAIALVYIGRVCNECGLDQKQVTKVNERVIMQPQMREGIVLAGVCVAEKYGALPNLPEIALGGYLIAYVGGLTALVRELKAEFKPKAPIIPLPSPDAMRLRNSQISSDGPRSNEPRNK